MSETYNQVVARRVREEITAFESDPSARGQAQIDHYVQTRRELEAELADIYFEGGFLERHSRAVGFHKCRYDWDWRIK